MFPNVVLPRLLRSNLQRLVSNRGNLLGPQQGPARPQSPFAAKGRKEGEAPFGLDPKDAKQLMSKPPQRISIISALLFLLVAFFVGSQMMNLMNTKETDALITSEFVQAVEQDRVKNVVYDAGNYTVSGSYYPAATAG